MYMEARSYQYGTIDAVPDNAVGAEPHADGHPFEHMSRAGLYRSIRPDVDQGCHVLAFHRAFHCSWSRADNISATLSVTST